MNNLYQDGFCFNKLHDGCILIDAKWANLAERRLAAAPELLEALRGLFEHCAMVHKYWGDNSNLRAADSAIKNAHAVIARAEKMGGKV